MSLRAGKEEAVELTETQRLVLIQASQREDGNVCPTWKLRGATQTSVLRSLERKGLVEQLPWPPGPRITRITDAGRKAIER